MSRAVLILASSAVRARATDWIARAPEGTRVEFKGARRTTAQSDKMWAMLTEIAVQKTHSGRKYDADEWKCIFLDALGHATKFIPKLNGEGFIAYGQRSSDLSKAEMSDLIELMYSWGAGNGVKFQEPHQEPSTARAA